VVLAEVRATDRDSGAFGQVKNEVTIVLAEVTATERGQWSIWSVKEHEVTIVLKMVRGTERDSRAFGQVKKQEVTIVLKIVRTTDRHRVAVGQVKNMRSPLSSRWSENCGAHCLSSRGVKQIPSLPIDRFFWACLALFYLKDFPARRLCTACCPVKTARCTKSSQLRREMVRRC
jgi:hypothetical protein